MQTFMRHIEASSCSDTALRNKFSPRVIVEKIDLDSRQVFVAREDLLPGGSKQRACAFLLTSLVSQGFTEFIYASPFCGFAQVALAYMCSQLDLRCQIFCERQPLNEDESDTDFSKIAQSYGAQIHHVGTLQEAEDHAQRASLETAGRYKIPLGFNCVDFRKAYALELSLQWNIIKSELRHPPKRLWLPVGSGTLASVFSQIVDDNTGIKCVDVHVLSSSDERIIALSKKSNIVLFSARESFREKAAMKPSIPSNVYYDAKLWQFLLEYAKDGDMWWNVAK